MRGLLCLVVLGSLAAGCHSGLERALLRNNVESMGCSYGEMTVRSVGRATYEVSGCGQARTFECRDGQCERIGVDTTGERPPTTWTDEAVTRALRAVNAAVLECVPGREEITLEVHISRGGRVDRWGRWDLPPEEQRCVRDALHRIRIPVTVDAGRHVAFVFGGVAEDLRATGAAAGLRSPVPITTEAPGSSGSPALPEAGGSTNLAVPPPPAAEETVPPPPSSATSDPGDE